MLNLKIYKSYYFYLSLMVVISISVAFEKPSQSSSDIHGITIINDELLAEKTIDALMNPKYDSICIDMAKLIKNLGPLGAQKVAERLAVQSDEKQIRKLIQCFLHFETDAIDYAPMVMKLISERLGKELSEDQFETLLICFDALVAVNPNSEEVFDLGKSCIDYDFWNEDSLPFVASYENKGHQIVRDRLRKKACNILGWIGGKRSIEILADQGAKENLRGNNPLANIFTWTGAYVETYGSLRHDYEIRINALG